MSGTDIGWATRPCSRCSVAAGRWSWEVCILMRTLVLSCASGTGPGGVEGLSAAHSVLESRRDHEAVGSLLHDTRCFQMRHPRLQLCDVRH
eukprot:3418515-Rhodomonas_salina.2